MPDLDDMNNNPYQFLERMSTEKLKSIVRADFESGDSDDAANDELITRILEVIAQREESDPTAPHFDVEAGWKNFLEYDRPTEEQVPRDLNGKRERQADLEAPQPKRAGHRFLRIAAIAAAVMCMCAVAASAFEFNIFKMFAQWTQEVFQFQSEALPSAGLEADAGVALKRSQILEDMLAEQGVTQPVSPRWIPTGFQFMSLNAYTDVNTPMFSALYENTESGQMILVSAIVHDVPQAAIQEKDENPVEVYQAAGIDHYMMENKDVLVAAWFADNVECSISGDITEAEMKTMINSIYEE